MPRTVYDEEAEGDTTEPNFRSSHPPPPPHTHTHTPKLHHLNRPTNPSHSRPLNSTDLYRPQTEPEDPEMDMAVEDEEDDEGSDEDEDEGSDEYDEEDSDDE